MDAVPITDWVPFADWADGRVLLGDRRPTKADLDYHLTTLFRRCGRGLAGDPLSRQPARRGGLPWCSPSSRCSTIRRRRHRR